MPSTRYPKLWFPNGAVVSSHYLASQAGASVLASGGTAVDAALAALGVLWAARPGGSGPAVGATVCVQPAPTGRPQAFAVSPLRALGTDGRPSAIPDTEPSPLIALCLRLLREWGTRSLPDLLEPARAYASSGVPLVGTARHMAECMPVVRAAPAMKPQRMRSPALARYLDTLGAPSELARATHAFPTPDEIHVEGSCVLNARIWVAKDSPVPEMMRRAVQRRAAPPPAATAGDREVNLDVEIHPRGNGLAASGNSPEDTANTSQMRRDGVSVIAYDHRGRAAMCTQGVTAAARGDWLVLAGPDSRPRMLLSAAAGTYTRPALAEIAGRCLLGASAQRAIEAPRLVHVVVPADAAEVEALALEIDWTMGMIRSGVDPRHLGGAAGY